MIKINQKEYDFANLSYETLQQVQSLEKTIREKDEEVIIIAYKKP